MTAHPDSPLRMARPLPDGTRLAVRELTLPEVDLRIGYFHDATDEHLDRLGVDRARLPSRDEWVRFYVEDYARALPQRQNVALAWELDGVVVGFSSVDNISFGDHAFMHLHIVDPHRRSHGLGAQFVRLSAIAYVRALDLRRLYCRPNALNIAPNRTLQRAGFRYDRGEHCRPSDMNTVQTVTRWVIDRDEVLRDETLHDEVLRADR